MLIITGILIFALGLASGFIVGEYVGEDVEFHKFDKDQDQ